MSTIRSLVADSGLTLPPYGIELSSARLVCVLLLAISVYSLCLVIYRCMELTPNDGDFP